MSGDIRVFHRGREKVKTLREFRGSSNSVGTADDKDCNTACHELNQCLYRDEIVNTVDELSRKIFPLSFFLFNLYYWFCVFYYPHFIISK